MSLPAPQPSRGEPGQERILAAAMDALTTLDPAALTIQQICRAAAVTPPTVYYHFGSKDGLLAAAIERTLADLLAVLDRQVPLYGPLEEQLASATAAWGAMILAPTRPLAVFSWAALLTAAQSLECRQALLDARRGSEARLAEGLRAHLADDAARAGLATLIVDVLLAAALEYHLDADANAVRRRMDYLADTIRNAADS